MRRGPTTFALMLATVVLALTVALTLSTMLITRSGLHMLGETYGRLAVSAAIAADAIADRDDPSARTTLAGLQRSGLRLSMTPPPASPDNARIAPAVAEVGRSVGEMLGDPARVRVIQVPETQIWIHSARDPRRWIVLHAASYRAQVIQSVLMMSAAAGLFALAIAGIAARVLVRPLERLSAHAGALLGGAPVEAQLAGSPREMRQLARAIGDAGAKLRGAAAERELMLAGISHDLRTPLARLRLALELGDANDPQRRDAMVADLDELDSALEQCLAFVRDGRDEALRDVDVATLAGQLIGLRTQPDDWRLEGAASMHASVRPTLLRRALGNLLDNAERYGAAPYRVVLARDAGWIDVAVEDSGAGVAPDRMAELGKPFVRGDHARGGVGVGLGLSIVARAAELHGGSLSLSNREGGGFEARMRIPGLRPSR